MSGLRQGEKWRLWRERPWRRATLTVGLRASRMGWPPMFWLRDPDGNSLIIVQPST